MGPARLARPKQRSAVKYLLSVVHLFLQLLRLPAYVVVGFDHELENCTFPCLLQSSFEKSENGIKIMFGSALIRITYEREILIP